MAEKLSFEELDKKINEENLKGILKSTENLRRYVKDHTELLPISPASSALSRTKILVFKPNTLSTPPRAGFDLDRAISKRLRALDLARQRLENPPKKHQKKPYRKGVIVAEGDSWFWHPELSTIPGQIFALSSDDFPIYMRNNAEWGYTLEKLLKNKDLKGDEDDEGFSGEKGYLTVLREEEPEYFLLSAGGNDLQALLASGKLLCRHDPNKNNGWILTGDGTNALRVIESQYRELLNEVTEKFPNLKVLTYGYAYSSSYGDDGTYIGQHLKKLGVPSEKRMEIMKGVLKEFNESIEAAVSDCGSSNVRYMDCQAALEACHMWYDDMHPNEEGFKALAKMFVEKMKKWK